LYMVYVEPGVVVQMGSATSQTSFLGYHGAFGDGNSVIHYAVMPAPGSPNPTPSSQGFGSAFDELTSVSSHELAEAVTDPNVNYSTMGWYDFQLNGEIGDLATGYESTITGANGTQYVVQDAVDQNDQLISPSTVQTPPTNPGLAAPTLTASAVSTTVAQLSWNAVSGTQGYRVYQIESGQAVLLGTVSASATSVQVSGLTPGANESFQVEAYNSTSIADSSVVNLTMPAPAVQAVTAPNVIAQATSSTSVALSWSGEPQATGYNIYWSDGYSVVLLGTVSATTNSVTITGLQPGSRSYFLVEAFNNVSYADSQWVYAATPYYSMVSNGGWGAYAEAQSSDWGAAPGMTPGTAAAAGGHHWGR
ncbi:MAG: fibronectin type III domain-containing protein, partial [Candidatus Saccharimonadales bacterium]